MSEPARLNLQTVGSVTVVGFQDRLLWEMLQVEQIDEELTALVEGNGIRRMVLDFAGVEMISSSVLGVLLRLKARMETLQGQFAIAGLRPELMRIFKITRLEDGFTFCADWEGAVQKVES